MLGRCHVAPFPLISLLFFFIKKHNSLFHLSLFYWKDKLFIVYLADEIVTTHFLFIIIIIIFKTPKCKCYEHNKP